MTTESEIGEVVARVRQKSLAVCENCSGEGYTDMGRSACATCFGAGVTTPEMLAALAKARMQDEDELAGILHKAFSHPDAVDHSAELVGVPMLIRTKGGWYVLGEDGMRFNLVCASRDPKTGATP